MSLVALVLAAGRGERLRQPLPKAWVPLAGRPLLQWTLEALLAVPELDRVVPVLPPGADSAWAALEAGIEERARLAPPVVGGAQRQDSLRAGMAALPPAADWVLVHDAARPWVRAEAVRRVVAAARAGGAALLATPVRDTIKRVRDGRVVETPDRAECWAAQTPQVFATALLREALAKAEAEGFLGTDDAQLVERLGAPVTVVPGDADNWKITGPEDLPAAEERLRKRAAGRAVP